MKCWLITGSLKTTKRIRFMISLRISKILLKNRSNLSKCKLKESLKIIRNGKMLTFIQNQPMLKQIMAIRRHWSRENITKMARLSNIKDKRSSFQMAQNRWLNKQMKAMVHRKNTLSKTRKAKNKLSTEIWLIWDSLFCLLSFDCIVI